jgi:hypothetical protein
MACSGTAFIGNEKLHRLRQGFSTGVPGEIVIEKKKHGFF